MKFVKSNFAKKLIIVLIALLVFNIAVPQQVNAGLLDGVDWGGILMNPICSLIGTLLGSVDLLLGGILRIPDVVGKTLSEVQHMFPITEEETNEGVKKLLEWDTANNMVTNAVFSWKLFVNILGDITNSNFSNWFVGPDTIFAGEIGILNANIFAPESGSGTKATLKQVIAEIYVVLRNISGLIMLAGLIYTGIRILLSSNIPTKKSQYLTLIQDWAIGMLLLMFSHLIMIGVFELSELFVQIFKNGFTKGTNLNFMLITTCFGDALWSEKLITLLMLAYMIYLTVMFAISYFKRFMWICVLIIFAPIISVMYAFGQQTKQIYSKWLKEFIMTVMIQPFHIVVYYVLVMVPLGISNGFQFGMSNLFEIVYALAAMAFIKPAEKYMRDLFGFSSGIAGMASAESGKQTFDAFREVGAQFKKNRELASGANSQTTDEDGQLHLKDMDNDEDEGLQYVLGMNKVGSLDELKEKYGEGGAKNSLLEAGYSEDEASKLLGIGEKIDDAKSDTLKEEPIREIIGDLTEEKTESEELGTLNVANLTIMAGNVEIPGINDANAAADQTDSGLSERIESGVEAANKETEKGKIDSDIEVDEPKKGKFGRAIDKVKGDWQESTQGIRSFAKVGGFIDLYKGLNSVRDTMYIGAPIQDWKADAQRMDTRKKERDEKAAYNFTHDSHNKKYIAEKMGLKELAKERYPNDTGKQQDWIDSKVERELDSLAKAFVPLGVTNVERAYGLKQDQKAFGYSPREAVEQSNKFEAFNRNAGNVSIINNNHSNANVNVQSVSEAVPNARQYYQNYGISNVQTMMKVDGLERELAQKLGNSLTEQMRTDISVALAQKGSVNYTGNDEQIKQIFKTINEITKKKGK